MIDRSIVCCLKVLEYITNNPSPERDEETKKRNVSIIFKNLSWSNRLNYCIQNETRNENTHRQFSEPFSFVEYTFKFIQSEKLLNDLPRVTISPKLPKASKKMIRNIDPPSLLQFTIVSTFVLAPCKRSRFIFSSFGVTRRVNFRAG